MKNFVCIWLIVILLGFHQANCDDCLESDESEVEECTETEYESYIECIRKRTKRQAPCGGSCNSCDCNHCSRNTCSSHCNTCCGNFDQPCETKYCCYKTCHSQCSNQGCRDTCRRTCTDRITNQKEPQVAVPAQVPNITTIINLHNKINNTNIIDVPINLKSDNINNITINTGSNSSTNTGPNQQCCQLVSPRQCTPITEFPFMRCFHLRRRICSNICSANIMHAQPHQICDQRDGGPPDCHNQVIYIPQPQPRCVYKPEWPYVNCNIPPANCEGCYNHYATNTPRPSDCPNSCYGDGYGVGPFYRQGPVYRPGFSPMPPCAQMGTCPPYYGGYGNPMAGGVDPMYGAQNSMPVPLSGVGYPPSAYDNFFTVQKNMEVPDLSKLFSNFTQKDEYYAQTLPITNSITQQAPKHVDPSLVKIETVNATDVLMTIKEMNDQSFEGNDIKVLPTSSVASHQSAPGQMSNMVLPVGPGNLDPFTGGNPAMPQAYEPVVRYQRNGKEFEEEIEEPTEKDISNTISATNDINSKESKQDKLNGTQELPLVDQSYKNQIKLNNFTATKKLGYSVTPNKGKKIEIPLKLS